MDSWIRTRKCFLPVSTPSKVCLSSVVHCLHRTWVWWEKMRRVQVRWHLFLEVVAVFAVMHLFLIRRNCRSCLNAFRPAWRMVRISLEVTKWSVFSCVIILGQAAQVLQEFINETAEFFMKTYPQLKTGREYRKIGLALIKKYPCLAEKGNHLKPEVNDEIWLWSFSFNWSIF